MLPKQCHEHDLAWVKRQVAMLPEALREKALDGYKRVYTEAYISEIIEYKKENTARFAANTRLREYVEKVINAKTIHRNGNDNS